MLFDGVFFIAARTHRYKRKGGPNVRFIPMMTDWKMCVRIHFDSTSVTHQQSTTIGRPPRRRKGCVTLLANQPSSQPASSIGQWVSVKWSIPGVVSEQTEEPAIHRWLSLFFSVERLCCGCWKIHWITIVWFGGRVLEAVWSEGAEQLEWRRNWPPEWLCVFRANNWAIKDYVLSANRYEFVVHAPYLLE